MLLALPESGPDQLPSLDAGTAHVWRLQVVVSTQTPEGQSPTGHTRFRERLFSLNETPAPAARLHAFATDEERARAARFRFDADRARFLGARGLLRALLGHYLAQPPSDVRFRVSATGKPSLDLPDPTPLHFNVSHSGDWALVALTRDGELGVDVEAARPLPDLTDLAARFFSPRESAALHQLDPAQREPAFFRIWSRKEAFVKATGEGIAAGLDTFAVSHDEETHVRLDIFEAPDAGARWTIRALSMPGGYAAAVAIPRPSCVIHQWEWTRQSSP